CSYAVYIVTVERSLYLMSLPHMPRQLTRLSYILCSLLGHQCFSAYLFCVLLVILCNEGQERSSLALLVSVHDSILHRKLNHTRGRERRETRRRHMASASLAYSVSPLYYTALGGVARIALRSVPVSPLPSAGSKISKRGSNLRISTGFKV